MAQSQATAAASAEQTSGKRVLGAFLSSHCKTVHFIRHAEATSNKAAEGLVSGSKERNDAYDDPAWFDARLSAEGLKQCAKLRESTEFLSYQLVLVSPLTRALHTAKLGLPDNPKIPVIALNAARERVGTHPCDSRRPVADVQTEFPNVDFSDVPAGPDPKLCKIMGGEWDRRETDEEIDVRIQQVLSYIGERSEERIALVGHSAWFQRMFKAHLAWDATKGNSWVENAELRSVVVAFDATSGEPAAKKSKA